MKKSVLCRVQAHEVERAADFVAQYYAFDGIPFDRQRVENGIRQLLEQPSLGAIWFIVTGGARVGHAVLTFSFDLEFGGKVATVTEVFIEAPARGQGLGRLVFAELEAVCREHGVSALELQVEHDNLEAQGFYRRLGFRFHDRIPASKRLE